MEGILEIRDILNRLNHREIKAARNYFTQHYSHTKELQLFNLIEGQGMHMKSGLESRISKMGYRSSNSKSFQKLRSRLKNKLYDYLATSMSIEEIRHIDDNSFLKHRLGKLIFQAGILIEKGFFVQANDMLRTTLRLAQDYEQFGEAAQSIEKIRNVFLLYNNRTEAEKLTEKIRHFQRLEEKYFRIESTFTLLLSDIELHSFSDLGRRAIRLKEEIESDPELMRCDRARLFTEYLDVLSAQILCDFRKAISIVIRRLKNFRNESMKHEIRMKMLFYNTFVELLFILNKNKSARHFANHPKIHSKPHFLSFRLRALENHSRLANNRHSPGNFMHLAASSEGSNALIVQFQNIHFEFLSGAFRKCIDMIDLDFRKYAVNSVQSADLMVLEIMCHWELNHLDLVDYKLNSLHKNLSYRSRFEMPRYYLMICRALQHFLRIHRSGHKVMLASIMRELSAAPVSGLISYRSLQPNLFLNWISSRYGAADNRNMSEAANLSGNGSVLTRVA